MRDERMDGADLKSKRTPLPGGLSGPCSPPLTILLSSSSPPNPSNPPPPASAPTPPSPSPPFAPPPPPRRFAKQTDAYLSPHLISISSISQTSPPSSLLHSLGPPLRCRFGLLSRSLSHLPRRPPPGAIFRKMSLCRHPLRENDERQALHKYARSHSRVK